MADYPFRGDRPETPSPFDLRAPADASRFDSIFWESIARRLETWRK